MVGANVCSMREFTTPSFPVYMYDGEGSYTVKTMGEVSNCNPMSSSLWLNLK